MPTVRSPSRAAPAPITAPTDDEAPPGVSSAAGIDAEPKAAGEPAPEFPRAAGGRGAFGINAARPRPRTLRLPVNRRSPPRRPPRHLGAPEIPAPDPDSFA